MPESYRGWIKINNLIISTLFLSCWLPPITKENMRLVPLMVSLCLSFIFPNGHLVTLMSHSATQLCESSHPYSAGKLSWRLRVKKNHTSQLSCCLVTKSCPTLVTPWTVALQAPLSMGFSMQEYWSGLPFPPSGDLPHPGIEPTSPALTIRFFTTEPPGKPNCLYKGY